MDSDQFLKDIQGKHVNFLIGSGASFGVVPTLWVKSLDCSFEKLLTSSDFNENQRKVLFFIWFELWIKKAMITEYDSTNSVHSQYNRFITNLVTFLNNEGFDKPKRVNIFTSNYDTLFEMTFDRLSIDNRLTYFNDGSRGFFKKFISTENFHLKISHSAMSDTIQREIPTINLLKIHGSVTWQNKEGKIIVGIENEAFKNLCVLSNEVVQNIENFNLTRNISSGGNIFNKSKLLISPSNYETGILYGQITLEKLQDELTRIYKNFHVNVEAFYEEYRKFPVVNPTKEKFSDTVFQQHYYQLLRMMSFELEKPDSVLIVFGFSFADEHILEIVKRSIVNPKLKIYVICFDESAESQIKERLGNIGNSKIEYLPSEKTEDVQNIQGNFSYLNSLFDGEVE